MLFRLKKASPQQLLRLRSFLSRLRLLLFTLRLRHRLRLLSLLRLPLRHRLPLRPRLRLPLRHRLPQLLRQARQAALPSSPRCPARS